MTAIVLLSAVLNLYRLSHEGLGNLYYAAAVKSMLMSWHNFFFVAADPLGAVSVDKPPLGLWIQALDAKVFGFSGLNLIIPEALAGTFSVVLIFVLVARSSGQWSGLLAALFLALTPVSVATNRNNTMDSLLVFILLMATWSLFQALSSNTISWLLVTGVLFGLGFNVKYAEGLIVVPAFVITYLLSAPHSYRRQMRDLAAAFGAFLFTSLLWLVPVSLTPASQRPWIGSTQNNSIWDLVWDYTSLGRIIPHASRTQPLSLGGPDALRLFHDSFGGQVSWLLPLALFSAIAMSIVGRWRRPLSSHQQAVILWGGWFVVGLTLFSTMGFLQPYYLVVLAPPIAALAAMGAAAMVRWETKSRFWPILPVSITGTAVVQLAQLQDYPAWESRLGPYIIIVTLTGLIIAISARWIKTRRSAVTMAGVSLGLIGILIAPAVWSLLPVLHGGNPWVPQGGPIVQTNNGTPATLIQSEQLLVATLRPTRGNERFLLGTIGSPVASQIFLSTGEPVMTLGGFSGNEPIPPPTQLIHSVRYLVVNQIQLTQPYALFSPASWDTELVRWLSSNGGWVRQHCPRQVVAASFSVYGPCTP
ncbi:MAG TPA: glycosyltransferase family 39 protein [Nitrolancea sp.]|nr:glycosyltransferase family 39 protein [Nitrolancea sp.]